MGDLQEVDRRQPGGHQLGIHVLLEVAHEEEPSRTDRAEQHDRRVVDGLAVVERPGGDRARDGPQDSDGDLVQSQAVARGEPSARRNAVGQLGHPGRVPRALAGQAGLVHRTDGIAIQEQAEPRDVVLVGMRQDHDVDPPIPGRQPLTERNEQPTRVRPTVDEHPATMPAVDEDGVALPDVEDHDVRHAAGSVRDRQREGDRRAHERDGSALRRRLARPLGAPVAFRRRGRGRLVAATGPRQRAAPARDAEDRDDRETRADGIPRRSELDAREGQAGAEAHDSHHCGVQGPRRQPDEHGQDRRQPGSGEHADHQCQGAGRHRRWHERHDHEVHERRDDGQAPELEEDDGRRGRLRGEGHAQDLGDPPADPPRRRA
jgi:hypothetical protein